MVGMRIEIPLTLGQGACDASMGAADCSILPRYLQGLGGWEGVGRGTLLRIRVEASGSCTTLHCYGWIENWSGACSGQ